MTDPVNITIPDDLRPHDGRFGCGPSKVRLEALQALADTGSTLLGTSHRQPPVKGQVERLRSGLADLFALPEGYEVLLANGGATAFWDMATYGLVRHRSRHYVFGEFSSKFAKATTAAPFLGEPDVVESAPGSRPTTVAGGDVDVQALTHNETSTGVMTDIRRPDDSAIVLVDATSGAGGLDVDLQQCDVYYFSLQKGFASEGGLVVAIVSPAAVDRMQELAGGDRYIPAFFDLPTVLDNSRKNQTYNTPAIATILLAAHQVDGMNADGGLQAMAAASAKKAAHLYGWADSRSWATPFVTDVDARSHVVATIDIDGVDADDVNAALRANGILDTDAYRKLGRNQLRIGMFPAVDLEDLQAFTACVDHVVEQLA